MRRLTFATVAFAAALAGTAHASIRLHSSPPQDDRDAAITATLTPPGADERAPPSAALVVAVMGMAIVAFTVLPAATDRIARRLEPDTATR